MLLLCLQTPRIHCPDGSSKSSAVATQHRQASRPVFMVGMVLPQMDLTQWPSARGWLLHSKLAKVGVGWRTGKSGESLSLSGENTAVLTKHLWPFFPPAGWELGWWMAVHAGPRFWSDCSRDTKQGLAAVPCNKWSWQPITQWFCFKALADIEAIYLFYILFL